MTESPDQLEPLTSTPGEPLAAMIIAALKDQGIEAVAEGGLTSGFRASGTGDVYVMVRQCDLQRARQALTDYRETAHDIDWDQVDFGDAE